LLYVSNLNFDDLLAVITITTGVVYCTEVLCGGDGRAVKEKYLSCRTFNIKIGRVIG
jgi:hypothetical protein